MNNTYSVDGRIGAIGAELGTTKGGKPYIKFSLANNSFSGGQEKTVWHEVTCYDPFIIENKKDKLKKGTWVFVTGVLDVDHRVKDNKLWINMNVTAYKIDIANSGGQSNAEANQTQIGESASQPSVYTGNTKSEAVAKTVPEEISTGTFDGSGGDGDLPF